ncbi:MAG: hypothetical protein QOF62_2610 [Pyrinomonadaceae bacterium]|nr:hypothetical protein [Pyrinomonadaceae bacterium]
MRSKIISLMLLALLSFACGTKPQNRVRTARVEELQEKTRVASEKLRHLATVCLTTQGESVEFNKTARESGAQTAEFAANMHAIAEKPESFKPERLPALSRIYTKMLRAEGAYLAETQAVDPRVSPQTAAQIDAIRAAHLEARDALQELVKLLPPVADEAMPSTTISPLSMRDASPLATVTPPPSRYLLRYNECVRQRTAFGVDTSPCAEWAKQE